MKILFIEPRPPAEHVFSRIKIPRLGNVLLGTIMRDLGHQVRIIVEEISGEVSSKDLAWADLVALSTITSTAPRSYQLGDQSQRLGKTVVYGGPHVTFLPSEALDHGHYVVRGEGERTLPDLIAALSRSRDLNGIQGLSFRRDGKVIDNPGRPLISDLDTLPIPDFSLVRDWKTRGQIVPIATSRGCPYNCKFCAVVPIFGRRMRFHSADRIIAEIRQNARGARHVFFCDDNFAADHRRAKALLRKMKEEGLTVEWSTQVRAEAARDVELLRLMKETNCFGVYIGFESINPRTLISLRKHQNLEEIKESIRTLKDHDLFVHGMFIAGADDDLPGSVIETMRFARRMKIDSVQFMMLTPLPGTETFQELADSGRLITRKWDLYDGSYAVFHPRSMTAYDLQAETFKAYRCFYSWRSVLARLARFELFYGFLRFYARLTTIKARRRVRHYKRMLKVNILEQARARLGVVSLKMNKPKMVFLADTLEGKYRLFLESFLENLGVEVMPLELKKCLTEANRNMREDLKRKMEAWKEKASLFLVPVIEDMDTLGRNGQENLKKGLRQIEDCLPEGLKKIELKIDLKEHSLYQSAVDLGLVLSRRLRRIRRAYRLAVKAAVPEGI